MSDLDADMERGRRAVAEARREVWPEYGGEMPEEFTNEKLWEYVERLETALAGKAMAMGFIGRMFRP